MDGWILQSTAPDRVLGATNDGPARSSTCESAPHRGEGVGVMTRRPHACPLHRQGVSSKGGSSRRARPAHSALVPRVPLHMQAAWVYECVSRCRCGGGASVLSPPLFHPTSSFSLDWTEPLTLDYTNQPAGTAGWGYPRHAVILSTSLQPAPNAPQGHTPAAPRTVPPSPHKPVPSRAGMGTARGRRPALLPPQRGED